MCLQCGPLLKAIDAYIQKADDDLADVLEAEGYAKPKKTVKYAQAIEDEVAEALVAETDYFLSEAGKAVDLETFAADVWPNVKINDAAREKLTTVFTERLGEFLPEYVGYYIERTDRELKLTTLSKRTTAWVKSWSEQLGDLMQLNSHKEIEAILEKGLKNGDGIAEFTRAILDSGIRDEYYKARRAALTEVLRAHSVAQQEAYMQSPVVVGKIWQHTGAYRNEPRQNHVDMDGQSVPVDKPYELVGADGTTYYPMYPRDPNLPPEESINCHCNSQPKVSEEILGLSLEERKRLQQEAIDEMDDEWEKELDARNRAKAGIDNPLTPDQPQEYNNNTQTRGHRTEEGLHGEDAVNAILEDTGLSKKESEKIANALDDFTSSGFREIRMAQEVGETSGVDAEHGKLIEKYIKAAPKWDGGNLYRQIVVSEDEIDGFVASYLDEEPIQQFGTSSWSSSKKGTLESIRASSLMRDEEDIVVVFKTSGTKQGTSVKHLSPTPWENEVIISKDARWKISDVPYEMYETVQNETFRVIYVECEEV